MHQKQWGAVALGKGRQSLGTFCASLFQEKMQKGGMFILYVACQRAHYRVSDIVLRHMSGVEACSFPLFE